MIYRKCSGEKLGIPLSEQKRLSNVVVDAVFDSVSIATTFKDTLKKAGVIFCSFSEAVIKHPDLIKKYLGDKESTLSKFLSSHSKNEIAIEITPTKIFHYDYSKRMKGI